MLKKAKKQKPVFINFMDDIAGMFAQRDVRDKSHPHQRYLVSVRKSAESLSDIVKHGSLDDCIGAVKGILRYDLEFLARTESQKKAILQHMKNFADALNNLDAIKNRPDEYRRQATGYIDAHKIDGLLPKDGMHGALRSYLGQLNARTSEYLTDEEAGYLSAQKELLIEITRRYELIQRGILDESGKD